KGLSAFVVDAAATGLTVTERIEVIAPHPLATLSFNSVRVPLKQRLGAPGGDLQMTQAAIADSASEVDAAALLVYRAAWTKDQGAARVTREAAMAKMVATESAQRVIDRAVQLHGGLGIKKGVKVEELYREIRALRIYEGASDVQKIIIARELLKNHPRRPAVAAE